jgi:ATP-dependent protease HslVU (ClpYQ) peptidase subunit
MPGVSAEDIAKKAMKIAGDKCVFTNHSVRLETLPKAVDPIDSSAEKK